MKLSLLDRNNKLFNINEKFPKIAIVGGLIKRKKIIESIEIFYFLFKKGYKFKVFIIGDGVLRQQIELKINSLNPKFGSMILLTGYLNNPIPILKRSDVFFMNSSCEGVSRSLLEACFLEKIIISRSNDGVDELISAGVVCYKFNNSREAEKLLLDFFKKNYRFHKATLPNKYHIVSVIKKYEEFLKIKKY